MNREAAINAAGTTFALHRAGHLWWRRTALACLGIVGLLSVALVLLALKSRPVDRAFAATPDGRVIELSPLSEPVMTAAALRNWTVTAVTESFTLGHHDWRLRLAQVRAYYTDQGYEGFVESLETSLFLKELRERRQVSAAVARGAPVIIDANIYDGRAGWTLEVPVLLSFDVGNRTQSESVLVRVLVLRVPIEERTTGIGIQQLLMERKGAT